MELARLGRGATVSEVGRRGKWVVITLAGPRGIIVIQPRMTGSFWLLEPDRPDHIRLVFHVDKPRALVWYCDTRRLGRIGWFPTAARRGAGVWPLARARCARDHARRARQAAVAHGTGHQAGPDGPEGARRHRQHLRRRGLAPGPHPPRACRVGPVDERSSRDCTAPSARCSPPRSPWRARASTPATGPCSGFEGGFLAQNSVYGREDLPCRRCSQPIKKTRITGLIGRPTYYCPRCQKRP